MPVKRTRKKNPHAVALVKARWQRTPKAERTELARKAGRARWAKLKKVERAELAARGGRASRGKSKKQKGAK